MTTTQTPPPAADLGSTPLFASWGRRAIAAVLDGGVLGAVAWFVGGDSITAPSLQPVFAAVEDGRAPWTSSAVLGAALLAMLVLQGLTGQTPGRRVLGIEVVRAAAGGPVDGPPGVLRSIGRWLAHFFDAILLLGYLRPIWHEERRTFADSLAGTVVLRRLPVRGRGEAAATTAAWVVVLVALPLGVAVGDSGGIERTGEVACAPGPDAVPDVVDGERPVRVESITVVREVEWSRTLRLWPGADRRHVTSEHVSVEVAWDVPQDVAPDDVLQVLTTVDGQTVDNEVPLDAGWIALPLEPPGGERVDVEVVADGSAVATCGASLP